MTAEDSKEAKSEKKEQKRGRGRPRKPDSEKKDPNEPKRPRGRPRIHPPKVKSGLPRGRPPLSPNKVSNLSLGQLRKIIKIKVRSGLASKKALKKPVGRPRIHPPKEETEDPNAPKRSRGRPRKSVETNGLSAAESDVDEEQTDEEIRTENEDESSPENQDVKEYHNMNLS
ncbi:hypothetical protein KUTeg_022132 [Tegillarca granosa]|uniref:Uncharacterized protein n=1 Tax=Tegillarca granosa TaxID=220873 RepID=A0ABQ9EBI0_TEGGR|nr:hypothetical protein KUTeg_022132 [Tegillarca granosa]